MKINWGPKIQFCRIHSKTHYYNLPRHKQHLISRDIYNFNISFLFPIPFQFSLQLFEPHLPSQHCLVTISDPICDLHHSLNSSSLIGISLNLFFVYLRDRSRRNFLVQITITSTIKSRK